MDIMEKFMVGCVVAGVLAIPVCLFGYPVYNVWAAGMQGKASLMQAEQERKIQIEQAKAELESAKLRAEAISIVGKASKEYPEYRTQEFIGAFAEAIKSDKVEQIIYVPTEANIPIVEARR
jgi:regulator of protease activity HflC (stomatin/prohibitin superfamily)